MSPMPLALYLAQILPNCFEEVKGKAVYRGSSRTDKTLKVWES